MKSFARLTVIAATLILSVQLANAGNIQPNLTALPSVRVLTSVPQESPINSNCPPPLACAAASDFSANAHLFGAATKSMPTVFHEGPINTNCPPPLTCAILNSANDDHIILSSRITKGNSQHSSIALLTLQSVPVATKIDSVTGYYPKPQIYDSTTFTSQSETD